MAGPGSGSWARAARLVLTATASLLTVTASLMVAPSPAAALSTYQIWGVNSSLEGIAKAQASLITSHLGITLHKELVVGYAVFKEDVANLSTVILDSENGNPDRSGPTCQIAVNKAWLDAQTAATAKEELLAHEVFHCFEHQIEPDIVTKDGDKNAGPWVIEGLARWVDLDLYPNDPVKDLYKWVPDYVEHPTRGLFERSYDAVGFWGHLEDVTHDLWSRIRDIVKQSVNYNNGRAFNAAVGPDRTAVLDSWGSSVFGLGPPDWTTVSPLKGSPGYPPATPDKIGATRGVALKPYTTAQLELEPPTSQPLVAIHLSPGVYGRFGVSENYTDKALTDKVYCAGPSCITAPVGCPGGGPSTLPPLTPLPTEPMLGVATAGIAGSADVTYFKSAQAGGFCPSPGPGPGGGGGGGGSGGGGSLGCHGSCGSSGGDPHLVTFAGEFYDFQAAGEFTLVSSRSGDLNVQVRQQPYPGSGEIAVNTAVAIRVGRATVEVDLAGLGRVNVLVNRKRTSVGRSPRSLPGGGRVDQSGPVVNVTWPDRSVVQVVGGASGLGCAGALDVAVKVAHNRFGHLSGLLGDAGVAAGSEFRSPSGKRYRASQLENAGVSASNFNSLYHGYGRSWLLTPRRSLFTYPHGKSTRSYLNPKFPSKALTLGTLTAGQFNAGQRACQDKGVKNAGLLANCIEDVGATNKSCFASAARALQTATGGPQPSGPPALAGGVSPIGWTQLSAHADADPLLYPSLATTGGRPFAAYQANGLSGVESASFSASSTGVGNVSRSDPVTGWRDIDGGPLLFGASGGGLQMIFSGHHTAAARDPLSGTSIAALEPGGTFGPAVNAGVSPYQPTGVKPHVDSGAVLASDGQTPVWTATSGFSLQVERGAQGATSADLSNLVSDQVPHDATLAHDSSGRLWLAWYAQTHDPSTNGQWMLQLDPTGAGPATGATAQHAPNSGISFGNIDAPSLVCAESCRIVYKDSSQNRIDLWGPGQRTPTTVVSDPGQVTEPTAAYTSSGRLWVSWVEVSTERVLAQLSGGRPIIILKPAGYNTPLYSASLAYGNLLVLVTNWENGNSGTGTGQTAVWATVVAGGA